MIASVVSPNKGGQFRPELPGNFNRKCWAVSTGITGQFAPESVGSLGRNHWAVCAGIGGQFRPEYALNDSSLKPRDFYRQILFQLGIVPQNLKSDAKRQYEHVVWDIYESQQKTVVAVVDEAHLLQGDMLQEIRFLTSFQIDSVSPLALIMVGQPELRATLQMRLFKPIAQRLSIRYHMGGLAAAEMREYVEHQLRAAGAQHPIFTAEAIDALYAHTRGIARETNNICTSCLLDAVVRKEKLIDTIHVARILTEYQE